MTEPKYPFQVDVARRSFLSRAAAVSTLMLAPGVNLITYAAGSGPQGGASPNVRWGLLVDTNKCPDSCSACIKACSDTQGWKYTGLPTDPQWIRKVTLNDPLTGVKRSLPMMCQHCADAPCVDVCPTGASFKRADGIVLVDRHICIGCRYCMMACPYDARSFVHEDVTDQLPDSPRGKGTVEACNLCAPRIDTGQRPACVEACEREGHGAMIFGDLNDPNSDIRRAMARYPAAQLRADLQLDTGVRYQGL